MRPAKFVFAALVFMLSCGCAISQTMTFFPRSTIERNGRSRSVRPDAGSATTVFVLDKRDSSTVGVYGWVEREILFLEIRNVCEGRQYRLPGDIRAEYCVTRGKKFESTREVRGTVLSEWVRKGQILLKLNLQASVFDERHSIIGSYIFNRTASDPGGEPDFTPPRLRPWYED